MARVTCICIYKHGWVTCWEVWESDGVLTMEEIALRWRSGSYNTQSSMIHSERDIRFNNHSIGSSKESVTCRVCASNVLPRAVGPFC